MLIKKEFSLKNGARLKSWLSPSSKLATAKFF
jgi:hypothetical protein